VTATQRRQAVTYLHDGRHVGVTHACRLVGMSRASFAYRSERAVRDAPVRARLRALAELHPRWGAPRLHWCLEREGLVRNHKRTERLYRLEGLLVRRRRRRRIPQLRVERPAPLQPNERWSLDFVHDRLADGRPIRILTVVDDCTRECPRLAVDHSLPSVRAIDALDDLAMERPLPARLVCDHGAEFASRAFLSWARLRGITLDFTRPGKPTDNAYIESVNGKFRDECLNEQYFLTLDDARMLIERWRQHYNRVRPHSALHHQPQLCTPSSSSTNQAQNYAYSNRGKVRRRRPMSSRQIIAAYEREYQRIGIHPGDRLPLPQGLESDIEYLVFLRTVPDGSGRAGFLAALAARGARSDGV
jgi:putative transposase